MSDVTPDDPAVVQGLAESLVAALGELNTNLEGWANRVDQIVVRIQNAAAAEVTPEGSVTGSVPESGPGSVAPSTESTDLSTEGGTTTQPSSTESTGESTGSAHTINDPSGDDTGWTP